MEVLIEIPRGAIPVGGSRATQNHVVRLEPYRTQKLDTFFYFPLAGEFTQYPAHASSDGKVLAKAEPATFKVVEELADGDKSSWEYVSQWGSKADVLGYLDQNNLVQTDLSKIAWRVRTDVDFFREVVQRLRTRKVFDRTVYAYALEHNLSEPLGQYLLMREDFLDRCGLALETKLVAIDPIERKRYQHLEYSPLVNARVGQLGKERKILNDAFHGQYNQLMRVLAYRASIDAEDRMTLTYFLLLQDRVEEAIAHFAKIDPANLPTKLQHDYFKAYIAFYTEDIAEARSVAQRYADYPVDRWRERFAEIASQLDEIDGKAGTVVNADSRDQTQDALADGEPGFDFQVESKKITIAYRNLEGVTVNYYNMDLEFLFSSNPFVSQDTGRFSMIKPNRTDQVALGGKGKGDKSIALPEEFHESNVLVEIVGAGVRKAHAYYANTMDVQVAESFGRLQVTGEDGKAIPSAYVKVYADVGGGKAKFYKDGYTDLRGKFDYTSLNTSEIDGAKRFSILVMSDGHGAMVKEANPPQR